MSVVPNTLPPFPVDDSTLNLVEHGLEARYEVGEDGALTVVGADFNLSQLLDFLSGQDPDNSVLIGYAGNVPIYECFDATYDRDDLIRALIAEIRHLRTAPAREAEEER